MDCTLVHLIVSFTFVSDGSYSIPIKGKTANITITHATSGIASTGIAGMIAHGNPTLAPDDPNGFMNVSVIIVELPFLVKSSIPGLTGTIFGNVDSRPDIIELKAHCLNYLNRLIDVVRFTTKRYWVRTLKSRDILIYKIQREENGVTNDELIFSASSPNPIPISVLDESSIKPQILDMLQKETPIPFFIKLWHDSLSFHSSGNFNEAVVFANISLEVLIGDHLTRKYTLKNKTEQETKKLVRKDFKKGVHDLVRKHFFNGLDDATLKKNKEPMYLKLENVRTKRENAIHHRSRILKKQESLEVLRQVGEISAWILTKSSTKS